MFIASKICVGHSAVDNGTVACDSACSEEKGIPSRALGFIGSAFKASNLSSTSSLRRVESSTTRPPMFDDKHRGGD